MQRSPRVLHSVITYSMFFPLLALRGWKQFEMDVVKHQETDEDKVRVLLYEGVTESFPQLAIGQVRTYR